MTQEYSLTPREKVFFDQNIAIGLKEQQAVEIAKFTSIVSHKVNEVGDDAAFSQRDLLLLMRESLHEHGKSVREEKQMLQEQLIQIKR